MASRKQQKEQARAARLAATEAEAAALRRRRRGLVGGVTAIALIVVVVAVVISSGGGSAALQTEAQAATTYRQVEHLLARIPQSGVRLGDPTAKVTMTYFGDLECPVCREFTLAVLPQFVRDYVRTGKAKIVYRSLCTATCHFNTPRFVPQQVAAYAAGRQDRFWQYAELFYREQGDETQPYATESYLRGLATQIPTLDFSKWLIDRREPALALQVRHDGALVSTLRLPQQTPEIVISGPKGSDAVPANGFPTPAWLSAAVQTVS